MAATKSPKEFIGDLTQEFRERMRPLADEHYNEEYFDAIGGPEAVVEQEFPAQAWREFYYGTLPPCRQADLIFRHGEPYHRDRDLIVGLGLQIKDEIKHARVISNIAEQFGYGADLATWEAEEHPDGYYETLTEVGPKSVDHEKPHLVSAAFQCSTEIVAAFQVQNMADYMGNHGYDEIAATLDEVASDEGDHIHVGRKIATRFAEPEDYDEMREVSEAKFESVRQYLLDLEPHN